MNMEVIEHVANPQGFTRICAEMLNPKGLIFVATISRTLKSFGLAIVGAGICAALAAQGHASVGKIYHAR